jgi:hypothetical protein
VPVVVTVLVCLFGLSVPLLVATCLVVFFGRTAILAVFIRVTVDLGEPMVVMLVFVVSLHLLGAAVVLDEKEDFVVISVDPSARFTTVSVIVSRRPSGWQTVFVDMLDMMGAVVALETWEQTSGVVLQGVNKPVCCLSFCKGDLNIAFIVLFRAFMVNADGVFFSVRRGEECIAAFFSFCAVGEVLLLTVLGLRLVLPAGDIAAPSNSAPYSSLKIFLNIS